MQDELGYGGMVHWEYHLSQADPWTIPETEERADWYGVNGMPHVQLDGTRSVLGAIVGDCEGSGERYREPILLRLRETRGLSPVWIDAEWSLDAISIHLDATFRLVSDREVGELQAVFVVYEDGLEWQGYPMPHVVRAIREEPVTLSALGDAEAIQVTIPIDTEWNEDELHAGVLLQDIETKEMIQARLFEHEYVPDFSFWIDHWVRSVEDLGGPGEFRGRLMNITDAARVYRVELGEPFGDWTSEFLVCGDETAHSEPLEIELAAGEVCDLRLRVLTGAEPAVRTGGLRVTSLDTGRSYEATVRLFGGSPSILFVDDDQLRDEDVVVRDGLAEAGLLYDHWDIEGDNQGRSPTPYDTNGYDIILWHHGSWSHYDPMTGEDFRSLIATMDAGTSILFTSQALLNDPGLDERFVTDYLGIASWTLDDGYLTADGVAGDPIGDGLGLDLEYELGTLAKADLVEPTEGGTACFTATDEAPAGLRFQRPEGVRAVFLAFPLNAIPPDAPEPHDLTTVVDRAIRWLRPQVPSASEEVVQVVPPSRILAARPNPFNPRTEILVRLSKAAASGPVELAIHDVSGRRVADLGGGSMGPGMHSVIWTGTAEDGAPVRSGVYWVRLTTREGRTAQKLILLK
ncbi:MAG: hypothetical protein GF328_02935 [Candidatus Latescibacteria bacterium]|nr:hypothetical protein [Candidatus Latescibacterota bacterium]